MEAEAAGGAANGNDDAAAAAPPKTPKTPKTPGKRKANAIDGAESEGSVKKPRAARPKKTTTAAAKIKEEEDKANDADESNINDDEAEGATNGAEVKDEEDTKDVAT